VKCNFVCQSDGRARHASGAGAAEPNVAIGTSRPLRNVRLESAKRAKADIDQATSRLAFMSAAYIPDMSYEDTKRAVRHQRQAVAIDNAAAQLADALECMRTGVPFLRPRLTHARLFER
jgi:hypothetical protein